jgi:hypothetical protein
MTREVKREDWAPWGPWSRRRWPDNGHQPAPGEGWGGRGGGGIRTVGQSPSAADRQLLGGTYNPIVGWQAQPRLRLFRPRIVASPGIALVLFRETGQLDPLLPTKGAITLRFLSDVRAIYRIDVSEHALGFRFRLPCARDPHEFIADVDLVCAVSEPAKVVERWMTDVRRVLEPRLEEALRAVSGGFAIDQRDDAERALRDELRDRASKGELDNALQIDRVGLRLHMDEATQTHLTGRVGLERDIDRAGLLAEVMNGRDWTLLAVQLERNPGSVSEAIAAISSRQQLDLDSKIKVLSFLLDKNVIEEAQLAEAGTKGVLGRALLDALNLTRPEASPALPSEGGADQPEPEPPRTVKTVPATETVPVAETDSE